MIQIKPMLAKIASKDYLGKPGYIYEPKLDGIRALMHISEKKIWFRSRNNKDLTERFSNAQLSGMMQSIKAKSCIIDGEIVAFDKKGNPDFNLLQNQGSPVFVAFDIIEKDGKDLKGLSLLQRKDILGKTVIDREDLQTNYFTQDGKKLWHSVKKRKLEGVMAKKSDSIYLEERSDNWLKIKLVSTIDCIIIGFTQEKRKISSLALGLYENKEIIYVGKVGTGFSEKFIEDFSANLEKSAKSYKSILRHDIPKGVILVKPEYVAEIEYLEFTPDRKLRAPVFKRLREDKNIAECTFPGDG